MQDNALKTIKSIRPKKIIIPILIGVIVIVYMLYNEISSVDLLQINPVGYIPDNEWKKVDYNKTRDTVVCELTDSVLFKSDSLKLEIKYFSENSNERSVSHTDTIVFTASAQHLVCTDKEVKIDIHRNKSSGIIFVFNAQLESPFSALHFTWYTMFWILMAFLMMAIRDFGYMLRLKVLCDFELSWRQCFNVIMLWEFTSAVTPSAIGGTGVAIVLINKEGINVGRGSAIVMLTSFLDELYFFLLIPILFAITGLSLFTIGSHGITGETVSFTNEFFYFAVIGYTLIFFWVLGIGYGIFVNPRAFKMLILWIFKLPFLRRWRQGANKAGSELIESSREFNGKSFLFWIKAFGSTVFSWTGRYWIVNILLIGLIDALNGDATILRHFLVFARQLVMWIMQLVSPTPGASGFSEYVFSRYLGEFIPLGFAVSLALIWRIISYYPYLFVGVIILPKWIKRKFGRKKNKELN